MIDKPLQPHYDIVIVGAGMVGAAIACGLAPLGHQILLLDQQLPGAFDPNSPPDIRVSALSLGTELLLSELGAWEQIKAMRSCPYRRLAVWEHRPSLLLGSLPIPKGKTLFSADEVAQTHLGHIVENRVTQIALLKQVDRFDNISLNTDNKLTHIDFQSPNPTLTLDQNGTATQVQTDLVIGADGAYSKVREWAHLGCSSNQYTQEALVATVSYEGHQEDITWQGFTPTGPRAFLPLPDINGKHYASLVWYDLPKRINSLLAMTNADFASELKQHFPAELPPILEVIERGAFPLIKRQVEHYVRPGLALAGDAAHTINPLAGQGVNLGFQDARCLIREIKEAHDRQQSISDVALLNRYEKMRKRENQLMMSTMDVFYHAFSNDIAPLKLIRNIGLAAAQRFTPGKKQVLKFALGLQNQ